MFFQAQLGAKHPGRIQKSVAVHHAVAHKLRIFQPGDHAEHPLLLTPFEVCLEAHDVIQGALLIFCAQLHICPRAVAGVGVYQTHRAQRAKPHGVGAPGSHDLNGHTALVHGDGIGLFAVSVRVGLCALLGAGIKVVQGGTLRSGKRGMKGLIFCLVEGAVQIVGLATVIAGSGEHLAVVQTFGGDDGCNGIVEMQPLVPGQASDLVGQCAVGQRAGGHQNGSALVDGFHLLPVDSDILTLLHHAGDSGAEGIAVYRQRAAGGHAGLLGGGQQPTAHAAHLFLQQTGGGVQPLSLQAVGADQLCKALAFVGGGKVDGLLLVQLYLHALARQPESRFAARQTRAQNSYFIFAHLVFPLNPTLSVIAKEGGCSVFSEKLPPSGGRLLSVSPFRAVQSFLGTGISKPHPSLAQYSLPPLRNRVLPHFSHLVATGISQVIKSQSG